jgi:hypothetical protein
MISDLAYRQYHVLFHPAAMPPPMVLNIDGAIVRSMLNDLDVAQINASMKRIASARREQACLENAYYFVRELRLPVQRLCWMWRCRRPPGSQ